MKGLARPLVAVVGVLTLVAYVLVAAIHVTAEVAGPRSAATYALSWSEDPESFPQRDAVTDRHCHECSSASIPAATQIASVQIPKASPPWPLFDGIPRGLAAGVDPPPPKQVR